MQKQKVQVTIKYEYEADPPAYITEGEIIGERELVDKIMEIDGVPEHLIEFIRLPVTVEIKTELPNGEEFTKSMLVTE